MNAKVSTWPVKNFEPIENANFPKLPDDIVDDLSSDQYWGYRICLAGHVRILRPRFAKASDQPYCSLKMADFGLPHSSFLYINKTAFKMFGAIDKFLFENLLSNLVQYQKRK